MIKVIKCLSDESGDWNKAVSQFGGSVYHLWDWSQVYAEAYGFRPEYFLAKNKDRIEGLLPSVRTGLVRGALVSMPFGDFAGPLGSSVARKTLLKYINGQKSSYEIYSPDIQETIRAPGVFQDFVLETSQSYETIRKTPYHHKTRNMVVKSERNGIRTFIEKLNPDNIIRFYGLYLRTVKKIGTLALSLKLFQSVTKYFAPEILLFASENHSSFIGFLWCFRWNNVLYIWSNATDEKSLSLGVNYALYDSAIKYACHNRMLKIHFGSTGLDSTQAFFKERWGAKPVPIYLFSNNSQNPNRRRQGIKLSKPLIKIAPNPVYQLISQFSLKYL